MLMRELPRKGLHERVFPLGNGIIALVFGKVKPIRTVMVHISHAYLIDDSQIGAQPIDVATGTHASYDMHACVKVFTPHAEGL